MARRTTLVKLLDDLRAKARLSLNPAHNVDARQAQVKLLQSVQDWLWEDFDWPHLRVTREILVQKGQRYYSPHEDIPIDRIERIDLWSDGAWRRILPGVGPAEYTTWNSDLGQTNWPPRRWRIHEDEMIELWPISDVNAVSATREGVIQITGIRKLRPLVTDSDRADLDDRLLVLFAAAESLAASGAKDAQLKFDQAQSLYMRQRGNLTPRKQHRMFGIGEPQLPRRVTITQYRRPD